MSSASAPAMMINANYTVPQSQPASAIGPNFLDTPIGGAAQSKPVAIKDGMPKVIVNHGTNTTDEMGVVVGFESTPLKLSRDGKRILSARNADGKTFRQLFIAQHGAAAYNAYRKPVRKALLEERFNANALYASGVRQVPVEQSPALVEAYKAFDNGSLVDVTAAAPEATATPTAAATATPAKTGATSRVAVTARGRAALVGKGAQSRTVTAAIAFADHAVSQALKLTQPAAVKQLSPDTVAAARAIHKKANAIRADGKRKADELRQAARDKQWAALNHDVLMGGIGLAGASAMALLLALLLRRRRAGQTLADQPSAPVEAPPFVVQEASEKLDILELPREAIIKQVAMPSDGDFMKALDNLLQEKGLQPVSLPEQKLAIVEPVAQQADNPKEDRSVPVVSGNRVGHSIPGTLHANSNGTVLGCQIEDEDGTISWQPFEPTLTLAAVKCVPAAIKLPITESAAAVIAAQTAGEDLPPIAVEPKAVPLAAVPTRAKRTLGFASKMGFGALIVSAVITGAAVEVVAKAAESITAKKPKPARPVIQPAKISVAPNVA